MFSSRSLRLTQSKAIIGAFLLITGCGGGGGGGGVGGPTLPANAVTISASNALDIANEAASFASVISDLTAVFYADLKTEPPPSIPDVIELIIDQVTEERRRSLSVDTGANKEIFDYSSELCFTGTAIADITETANSARGTISLTECDAGGIFVDGGLSFAFDLSLDDSFFDYDAAFDGTLAFDFDDLIVTIVINLRETANTGTGAFSTTIDYSSATSSGPAAGYLVTTVQPIVGNAFALEITGGLLVVTGADNTRLRITVDSADMATVELDDGLGGGFLFVDTIFITL